mmetsp:Transcript_1790/g.5443  ORF Transcript_1790/g.5443 Transcript_1790/m.5443 type:complete len:250 (-) Transcript_1790:509-1258(-)
MLHGLPQGGAWQRVVPARHVAHHRLFRRRRTRPRDDPSARRLCASHLPAPPPRHGGRRARGRREAAPHPGGGQGRDQPQVPTVGDAALQAARAGPADGVRGSARRGRPALLRHHGGGRQLRRRPPAGVCVAPVAVGQPPRPSLAALPHHPRGGRGALRGARARPEQAAPLARLPQHPTGQRGDQMARNRLHRPLRRLLALLRRRGAARAARRLEPSAPGRRRDVPEARLVPARAVGLHRDQRHTANVRV